VTIEIPQRGDREYIRACGIFAIFLAASPARAPCLIGCTRDLGRSLESIRKRWHWSIEITHAWWMPDVSGARSIVAAITSAFPTDSQGRFDASADEIAGKIEIAARSLGLTLTQHVDMLSRVKIAGARVDSVIGSASANGQLRWFNAAYRRWRTSAPAEQALALPYGAARARLRAVMVRRLARGEPAAVETALAEVFPSEVPAPAQNPGSGPVWRVGRGGDGPQGEKRAYGLPSGRAGLWPRDTVDPLPAPRK
jgi:hypothetical protein